MNMKVENEMALPITKSVTVMLLEPYAGKLARTVLRGESSRKGADLLDLYMDYVCFYRFYRKNLLATLFLFFLRIMGGMTVSSSLPNSFQRAAKNSLFLGSNTRAEARGSFGVGE